MMFWRSILLLLAALIVTPVDAAILISTASGNIDATGTWNVVDSTGTNAYLSNDGGWGSFDANADWAATTNIAITEQSPGWSVSGWFAVDLTSNTALGTVTSFTGGSPGINSRLSVSGTTSGSGGDIIAIAPANFGKTTLTSSFQGSANTFSLNGVETVKGFAIKVASTPASGATGTITAQILDNGSNVCAQTVNVSDLPVGVQPGMNDGGWIVLTCSGGNFTSVAGHSYAIQVQTSGGASTVNLWTNGTAAFFSHLIVTTATQSGGPAASDKFIVIGNLTGAGTHNAFTVTVETTANTSYGSASNTEQDPSIAVGYLGTLAFASAASTNYKMEFVGPLVVYNGGKFTQGTVGTPIPSSSTAIVTMNATVTGDTGLNCRSGATVNITGAPRTTGKLINHTHITTAANSGASSLSVASDTGWLSGDSIVIAGTTPGTSTQSELLTLSGNATSTSLPISSTLVNTHISQTVAYTGANNVAYSMPMNADVMLLSYNVNFNGTGYATAGYLYSQPNCTFAGAWTGYRFIGGTNAGQRGIEVDTGGSGIGPGGSFSLTYSAVFDTPDSGIYLGTANPYWGGTDSTPMLVQHINVYNAARQATGIPVNGRSLTNPVSLSPTENPYTIFDDVVISDSGREQTTAYLAAANIQLTNLTVANSGAQSSNGIVIQQFSIGALWYQGVVTGINSDSLGGGINQWGPIQAYSSNTGVLGFLFLGTGGGKINGMYLWNNQARLQPGTWNIIVDPFYEYDTSFGIYLPTSHIWLKNGFIGFSSLGSGAGNSATTYDGNIATTIFDNMDLCPGSAQHSAFGNTCSVISINNDFFPYAQPANAQIIGRNTSMNPSGIFPIAHGQTGWNWPVFVSVDCVTCALKHANWLPNGTISYDSTIFHSGSASTRLTPVATVIAGTIAGTTLTITDIYSGQLAVDSLLQGAGVAPGTLVMLMTSGSGCVAGPIISSCVFQLSRASTVASTTPMLATFTKSQTSGTTRLQSGAFPGGGVKVAAASGKTVNVCVWARTSLAADAGGATGGYQGDPPRLIERSNPAMGVQADKVLATYSASQGTWQQLCGTSDVAPGDGVFEFVVDADVTVAAAVGYANGNLGWVNIGDWSAN